MKVTEAMVVIVEMEAAEGTAAMVETAVEMVVICLMDYLRFLASLAVW